MSENFLDADAAVESYLSNSNIIIQTDTSAGEPFTSSLDPVMWGALFFVWVLLYIPRLITALLKGADKYETNMFDGWWISGIILLSWSYTEKLNVESILGCFFVFSLFFWPLWLNRQKILNISRKFRICVSIIIIWTLSVFIWVFGNDIWDIFEDERITVFFLTLLLPPLFILLLWKLFVWFSSAPRP